MTNPDPANPTPRRRRWVKPAIIAATATAVLVGGIAAWTVTRPDDPEPPAAVFHSEDYTWTDAELEPWRQDGALTPLPDAVAPAPCAENPDQGLCRLSEIMRGTDR